MKKEEEMWVERIITPHPTGLFEENETTVGEYLDRILQAGGPVQPVKGPRRLQQAAEILLSACVSVFSESDG